jgi:hypothetical protein
VIGIEAAIRAQRVEPLTTPWQTAESTLAIDTAGRCTFHRGQCGVYESRPQSCRHFPYVCLIDARGVSVSLSHYCPTAASLLFEHEGPIEIVEGPAPVVGLEIPEGLDARESLPPRESERRLMSLDDFSRWEGEQVQQFKSSRVQKFAEFAPVVERYLAAKLFASWAVYQHEDGIGAALALVDRAEALLTQHIGHLDVDAPRLKEAIRQTDLVLVHGVV